MGYVSTCLPGIDLQLTVTPEATSESERFTKIVDPPLKKEPLESVDALRRSKLLPVELKLPLVKSVRLPETAFITRKEDELI